jgi:hypothetical protein
VPSLPPILRSRRARAIALVAACGLAVRAALPYALARGIAWGGERATGLGVSVANVDLGLLQGRFVLDGLAVAGPRHPPVEPGVVDAETALIGWQRLALNLEWLDLLLGRVRFSDFSLAGLDGRLELDPAGRPILPVLGAPEAPGGEAGPSAGEPTPTQAEPPAPEGEGDGWPILVDRLALSDVAFELLDGHEAPAVSVGLEGLELSDVASDASGLALGAIGIRAPSVRVRRDYLLGEPAPAPEPGPGEAAATAGPEPAADTYRMEELHVERAEFTLLTDAGPIRMALRMDATGLTTAPGVRFPLEVALEVERGAIELSGDLGVAPPVFDGKLAWRGLPLSPLLMVARPDLVGWVESHAASGDLALDLRTEGGSEAAAGLRLSGTVVSENLSFRDPSQGDLSLGWRRFEVPIEEVFFPLGDAAAATPVRVALGAVRLLEPRFSYRKPCPALDVLFPPSEAEPGAEAGAQAEAEAEAGPEPVVSVASFDLTGGGAGFEDRDVRPADAGRIRDLALSLRDVRLPEATVGQLSLSAGLHGRSRLTVRGSHGESRSDVTASLKSLPLAPFNPYATGAAGYRVDEGQLSLDTKARRDASGWKIDNGLLLYRLRLSPTGTARLDQLIGVPVDLAMALLRDLEGNVRLGIPIAFDRKGVRVGIGSVVRDALRAAIAGTVTSPLKMMGAAFDLAKGGLSVEPLRMEPGRAVLAPGQDEGVGSLGALLETRPELAVRLTGMAGDADHDGLAERMLAERMMAGGELPEVEDAGGYLARRRVRAALAKRGRGDPAELDEDDASLLARYVAATSVPPERFDALARGRAEAASALFVTGHGLTAEHVRVADETLRGDPGVRIAFEAR